ncbi:MAG TPA: DNA-deoxyinosine glycosylase [Methylotenera sp.]|nr:DNA-deoxyinosine glycosylase [Methylotenera sp.]
MTKIIQSFPPIANEQAQVLILGSMPGVQSLAAGQYYAHKQNAFWKILGDIVGFSPQTPYAQRLEKLLANRIAVWDVLHSCERKGSLDSAIESAIVNDFESFYAYHPHLQLIGFNGAAAERYYRIHVLPKLKDRDFNYIRLPSTSPAHATLRYAEKLALWKSALTDLIS